MSKMSTCQRIGAVMMLFLIPLDYLCHLRPSLYGPSFFWAFALTAIFLRRYRFYGLALIGCVCNGAACLANGGLMPAITTLPMDKYHCYVTASTRLFWLCDIFPLGGSGAYSIGDLFVTGFGLAYLLGFVVSKLRRNRDSGLPTMVARTQPQVLGGAPVFGSPE